MVFAEGKMKSKKLLATLLAVALTLPMCACKPKSTDTTEDSSSESSAKHSTETTETETVAPTDSSTETEPSGEPTVPSLVTDEAEDPIVIYGYDKDFKNELKEYLTDIEYEYVYVEPAQYYQELKKAISEGEKKPDLFMMDADHLYDFSHSDYSIGIEQVGISHQDLADQFEYTYKAATDKDHAVKALAYDLAPTAVFYNRPIMDDYAGSPDPANVMPFVNEWDRFLDLAREVNRASQSNIKLVADRSQIEKIYWAGHEGSWIEDGKVTIGPDFEQYLLLQETLSAEALTHELPVGSEEWKQSISQGNTVMFYGSLETAADVIGYVPGHTEKTEPEPTQETDATGQTVETTVPEVTGWSIVPAPNPSYDGGSWLMVASSCDRKATAAKILRILTLDQTTLTAMAVKGRFVNSISIMEKCAKDPNFASDFLAGQNPYAILVAEAESIQIPDDPTTDKYARQEIDELLFSYLNGEIETIEEVKELYIVGMEELMGLS